MTNPIEPQTRPIVTRAEAKALGFVRYFTGKPCLHGHVVDRRVSDGHCWACQATRDKAYKLKNADKERARQRARSKRNRVKKTLHMAAWRARNPGRDRANELIRIAKNPEKEKARRMRDAEIRREKPDRERASRANWKTRNPEKAKQKYLRDLTAVRANPERRCAHAAKYYASHKEKEAARHRLYAKKHPEKVRANCRNRQARKRMAEGSHTADQIIGLFKKQRGRCGYFLVCGRLLKSGYDVDHIKAIVNGGSNRVGNLQLLCPSCNRSKGKKDALTFARQKGLLL